MAENNLSIFDNGNNGILKNPGDQLSAVITENGNKIIKVYTNNGNDKHSAIQYTNGTVVETIVKKPN